MQRLPTSDLVSSQLQAVTKTLSKLFEFKAINKINDWYLWCLLFSKTMNLKANFFYFDKYYNFFKIFPKSSFILFFRLFNKNLRKKQPVCEINESKWEKSNSQLKVFLALRSWFHFVNLNLVSRKWEVKITQSCLVWSNFDNERLIIWKRIEFYKFMQE